MKTIRVKVKPNARAPGLEQSGDGTWVARVKSLPIDGKANGELITLIARHFNLHKAQVSIKSGRFGRMKLVELND